MAYAVGRPVGGAVERNRLRRRLRAILQGLAPGIAPGAYLIGAGPAAAGLSHDQLQRTMAELLTTTALPGPGPGPFASA